MTRERRHTARGGGLRARFAASLLAVALLGGAAGGCVHKGPRLLNMPADALFNYGMEKYRGHKWDDAVTAFQQFTFRFPTAPRVEEARFMLAQSYFGKKEYITAANEFSRLADDYPAGAWADDARYKVCQSYYRLSPDVELDQQYTQSALDHCKSLLAYYPDSPFVPDAKKIIAEMEHKLAQKIYIGGEYYYKRHAYDSAIIYYQRAASRYPDTDVAPKALLRVVQSYEKMDWTEEAEAAKQKLLQAYPDSQAARQVRASRSTSDRAP